MLTLKEITTNNFNFLLKFTINEYTHDLFNYGEAKTMGRAAELASKEIRRLVPKGKDTPNHYIYRVKRDRDTIGWLWYEMTEEGKTGFLLYIFIDEKFRGQHLGSELLQLFEDEAKKRGADNLVLFVFVDNDRAVKMYQQYGWHIIKEAGYYDATRSTRYKMAKQLS